MYILLDIGGTKTRIAGSNDLESICEPVIIDTPQKFDEGMAIIVGEARRIAGSSPINAVALGIAASPNRQKTSLVGGGPNISDWADKPLKENLEEAFGAPVDIENDTAMGGLAQVMYGPAKGYEIAVYMTISTGVGGCRLVDGRIDKSARGFEPGWQILSSPTTCNVKSDRSWLGGHCTKGYVETIIGCACM